MHSTALIVGDIHGCLDELDELLATAGRRPGERLIFAGDLVDRGPDPVGVVRRARELGAEAILGNHDEKHLRYRRHQQRSEREPGYRNPMQPFAPERLAEHHGFSDEDWSFLGGLPLTLRASDRWHVVHAGLEPRRAFAAQRPAALLRCRRVERSTGHMLSLDAAARAGESDSDYWAEVWPGPESILFGHQVFLDGPRHFAPAPSVRCVGLDTGCCYGGALTAVRLAGDEIVETLSVPARRAYRPYARV